MVDFRCLSDEEDLFEENTLDGVERSTNFPNGWLIKSAQPGTAYFTRIEDELRPDLTLTKSCKTRRITYRWKGKIKFRGGVFNAQSNEYEDVVWVRLGIYDNRGDNMWCIAISKDRSVDSGLGLNFVSVIQGDYSRAGEYAGALLSNYSNNTWYEIDFVLELNFDYYRSVGTEVLLHLLSFHLELGVDGQQLLDEQDLNPNTSQKWFLVPFDDDEVLDQHCGFVEYGSSNENNYGLLDSFIILDLEEGNF